MTNKIINGLNCNVVKYNFFFILTNQYNNNEPYQVIFIKPKLICNTS
jgi:hypothetical protein